MSAPEHLSTDCRSEAGITVGLIDALITLARLLAPRDLWLPEVREALRDLASDEDLRAILEAGSPDGAETKSSTAP